MERIWRSYTVRVAIFVSLVVLYLKRKWRKFIQDGYDRIPLPAMEDYIEPKDSWIKQILGSNALPPSEVVEMYERMGKPKMYKSRLFFIPHIMSCDKADINIASTKPKALMFEVYRPFLGHDSILFQEGEKARKERTMLNRGFGQQTYRSVYHVMVEASERLRDRMVEQTEKSGGFGVEHLVSRATLEVIAQGGFSLDAHRDENVTYLEALKKMLRIPGNPICLLPFGKEFVEWWNQDSLRIVKELLNKTISKRLEEHTLSDARSNEVKDLLDLVIVSSKQVQAGESNMDIDWIRDQVQLLFIGGSDTSSVTMHWAFIILASRQDVQDRLKAEIREVNAADIQPFDRVAKMVYTEAFIKEVLRMYPPFGGIGRKCEDHDTEWKGIPIFDKRWTAISYISTLAHRREEYFPEPNKFDPDRWLERRVDPEAFGSFSHGFRACLGKNFAMMEMKTMLAVVLEKYRLVPMTEEQEGKLPRWGLVGQVAGPIDEWPLRLVPDTK